MAVYFDGPITNLYQIQQWIKAFEKIDETHSLVILARHKPIYDWILANTDLSCVYLKYLNDLQSFYESSPRLKCILYVNQAYKNFQSLIHSQALHVHINHGESDKTSTVSNQAKAYDRVFIVSDAAYEKYANNLIGADMSKFIKIGRPQLDGVQTLDRDEILQEFIPEPIPESELENELENEVVQEPLPIPTKIVLYAPTWEGTHKSMDYTSIRDYGETIVDKVLNDHRYYLIYRPHPKVGVADKKLAAIHSRIKKAVEEAPYAHFDGASDSLTLCELCDIAIFDNSAITVDYLKYDKPYIITDLFDNQKGVRVDKPLIAEGGQLIQQGDSPRIQEIINEQLESDPYQQKRREIRTEFLGDYAEGESTQKFIEEITKVMEDRDRLIHSSNE